jgi:hypothetical protein
VLVRGGSTKKKNLRMAWIGMMEIAVRGKEEKKKREEKGEERNCPLRF